MSQYTILVDSFKTKKYHLNILLHREDGPAIELFNGEKLWYLNGKYYGYNNDFTTNSWIKFVNTLIFS